MLKLHEENQIAYVSLDRPDVRNAFHPEMIKTITKTFLQLSKRKDLRAVVLRGEGKAFCAGADLNWMKEMVKYSFKKNQTDSHQLFEMFAAVADCQVPVVGVVHGAAFGGALGLIAACDYVLAEEKTQMCFSEVKLGIAPAVISYFVGRKCPQGIVLPLMLTGKVFSPADVVGAGLVHEIAPEAQMNEKLDQMLKLFREAGPEAVRATKKLVKEISTATKATAKTKTAKVIAERRVSKEGQEGLTGFLEKRSPSWKLS